VALAKWVQRALLKPNARLIVNAPPRHGKSELISHWLPTWYLEHWPEKQIILTSYGGDFASDWGKKVRDEFLMNTNCLTTLRTDSKAMGSWMTTKGGGMKTAGVGGPITGRGADLAIIDDPHKNWEEAMSATARERVKEWFNQTLYTRLEPGASIVLIQTRWHEDDLTGYLINNQEDDWEIIRFPAIAEEDNDLLGRVEGDALCPERYTSNRLRQIKKTLGTYAFAGLYQQRPAPLGGGMIQRDWFKYYDSLPDIIDNWVQTWDLTFKATGTSYVVGQVWARSGANYYLVDQSRAKMGFTEQLRAISVMSNRWPQATDKLIEDAADAQAVKSTLHNYIHGITLKPAKGSKEARLASISGIVESGNVYLPTKALYLDSFLSEVTLFPNGVNDDQVDAMTMALKHLSRFDSNLFTTDIQLSLAGEQASTWSAING
jgi:predicted phage terminase large subunit-like protein